MLTNKNPPPDYAPFGCIGALLFSLGTFIGLVILSDAVTSDGAGWLLVAVLIVLGAAGLVVAWKMRQAAKAKQRARARKSPTPPPPAALEELAPGEVRCPSCGHVFVPPRVMLVTEAVAQRYGKNPVQCPQCNHIWGR